MNTWGIASRREGKVGGEGRGCADINIAV